MIRYDCERCGECLESDDSFAGLTDDCPVCGHKNSVPKTRKQLREEKKRQKENELAELERQAIALRKEKELQKKDDEEKRKAQEQIEIKVRCSGCGKGFKAPAYDGGKKTKCPSCGHTITIPLQNRETKKCPMCAEEILLTAKKCKHCGEIFEFPSTEKTDTKNDNDPSDYSVALLIGFVLVIFIGAYFLAVGLGEKLPKLSESDKQLIRKSIYEAEMVYEARWSGDILYHNRQAQFNAALNALTEIGRDNPSSAIAISLQAAGRNISGSIRLGRISYDIAVLEQSLGNMNDYSKTMAKADKSFSEARERKEEFVKRAQLLLTKDYKGYAEELINREE